MNGEIRDGAGPDGSLESFALAFSQLNVARWGDHVSPHKPCMLLAVIDLAEAGDLERNSVRYDPALLDRYEEYFAAVRTESDHPNPYFPFFHLGSEPFWELQPQDGKAHVLQSMRTARRHGDILDNVAEARLDQNLHRLLQSRPARERLRDVLISRWFPTKEAAVCAVLGRRSIENDLERSMREGETVKAPRAVRNSVFRKVVLEVYDYRCAASGMRLVVPGVAVLMDAAHLIPFKFSRNDAPTNGIALTPTYHRALDRHLIAPGPDYKWHVSRVLDSRIRDYEPLLKLEGKAVLFFGDERYRPAREALEWRLHNLLDQ